MKTKSKLGTTRSMTMARYSRIVRAARLLPLLLLLTLPAGVQAQFNYTTNNGAITITGYTGPGGDVTIPSTINGLPVTGIGSWVFASRTNLIGVAIPDSIQCWGRCVQFLHQPDERDHSQQPHRHRVGCVLPLHEPGERDDWQQRHQHRE